MQKRLTVTLSETAFAHLSRLAQQEHRPPRLQAAHLLERSIQRQAAKSGTAPSGTAAGGLR